MALEVSDCAGVEPRLLASVVRVQILPVVIRGSSKLAFCGWVTSLNVNLLDRLQGFVTSSGFRRTLQGLLGGIQIQLKDPDTLPRVPVTDIWLDSDI